MQSGKTIYIWDKQLMKQCNKIPPLKKRASMVHSLIRAYELLPELQVVTSRPASHRELCAFHDKSYVDFLRLANKPENVRELKFQNEMDKFGLGYDCPVLSRMFNFARVISGASLQAAQMLVDGKARRAINWCGGWHHAQKSEAQGFCYVNDIALAIHKLLGKFSRVLYIDLDIHHGNGVEAAFESDSRVMTFSLHLHEPGYFPCTGALTDVGHGPGTFYSLNVPFKAGLCDRNLHHVFQKLSSQVLSYFAPEAVVVQCGADGLTKDPLGHFSLTHEGLGDCVRKVLAWELPTLFLGGGGYNLANTARLWAYLTSIIVNKHIPHEIPEHKYFLEYGMSYELPISPGMRPDLNNPEYVEGMIKTLSDNLEHVKGSCYNFSEF